MLRFFVKIERLKFFFGNRFRKYLFYAVGEIVLVVIGILIALAVNNRNSKIINERKIEGIFKEIKINLIHDIKEAERTIAYYNKKDSLIQLVMNNRVTKEMYEENYDLFFLLYYYRSYKLSDSGYNLLSEDLDLIPEKYNRLMPFLQNVYKGFSPLFISINEYLIDYTFRMLERWALQYKYYTLSDDEKITFFMNEDSFKNDAMLWRRYTQDSFVRNLHNYIYDAMMVFNLLEEINGGPDIDIIQSSNENIQPLDTIYLKGEVPEGFTDIQPEAKESYPVHKKVDDLSNLYIKNNLKEDCYLSNAVKTGNNFVPDEIASKATIYARPVIGQKYHVLTKDEKIIGSFIVPKSNSVLIIQN
mgnify:CR=1 FL=1